MVQMTGDGENDGLGWVDDRVSLAVEDYAVIYEEDGEEGVEEEDEGVEETRRMTSWAEAVETSDAYSVLLSLAPASETEPRGR